MEFYKTVQEKQKAEARMIRSCVDRDKLIAALNATMPDDIRIYTYKTCTKGLNIRKACRKRIYEYYLPLFMFQKSEDYKQKKPVTEEQEKQILERVKALCEIYKGTKNFHNYSTGMKPQDPRSKRYIMSVVPELISTEKQGKWIRFVLTGQSFIYHQIRKMIGMMVQIFQKDLPNVFLENSFFQNHVIIWLAPADGLFLNRMLFDGYNRKGDIPEALSFTEEEEKKIEEFRKVLQVVVIESDLKNQSFSKWMERIIENDNKHLEQGDEEEKAQQEESVDEEGD